MISKKARMELVRAISRRMDANEAEALQLKEEMEKALGQPKEKAAPKKAAPKRPTVKKKTETKKRRKVRSREQLVVDVEKVLKRYETGATCTRVAKEVGSNTNTVWDILNDLAEKNKIEWGKITVHGRTFDSALPKIRNNRSRAQA